MHMFKHVIFDLDGTLTDPGIGITRSIQYALGKFNIQASAESLYKFIGPPLRESFTKYFGFSSEQAEDAVAWYREYFSETGIFENTVYPGIPELLSGLQKRGCMVYLATTKPLVYAERILVHFDIRRYFDGLSGSRLDGTNGDKSELIAGIISGNSISDPMTAVMVGDRKYDIEGAKNNGVASIAVGYGYGEPGELAEAAPDFTASSVAELSLILAG